MNKSIVSVNKLGMVCLTVMATNGCAQLPTNLPIPEQISKVAQTSAQETEEQLDLSEDEKKLREQGQKLNQSFLDEFLAGIDKTALQGALGGAALGGAIGKVAGDDVGDIWKGAVSTGAIGAVAGVFVSWQQKQFASTEDLLDDTTQKVQSQNDSIETYIETAERVLAENRRTLDDLKAELRKGSVKKEQLEAKLKTTRSNSKEIVATIQESENQIAFFKNTLEEIKKRDPVADVQALVEQIEQNGKNIETLDNIDKELNALATA